MFNICYSKNYFYIFPGTESTNMTKLNVHNILVVMWVILVWNDVFVIQLILIWHTIILSGITISRYDHFLDCHWFGLPSLATVLTSWLCRFDCLHFLRYRKSFGLVIIKEPNTRSGQQIVRQIAVKKVDSVPKKVCVMLSKGLRKGCAKRVVCVYKGEIRHLNGPQLKCIYEMHIDDMLPVSVQMVVNYIGRYVDTDTIINSVSNRDRPALNYVC